MCETATPTDVTGLPTWLTVPEFADAAGIGETLARQLAETCVVRAHRHGFARKIMKIHRDEVARYLDATLIRPESDTDTDNRPGSAA